MKFFILWTVLIALNILLENVIAEEVVPSEKKTIRITLDGLSTKELTLNKSDSSVFFFNDTEDKNIHLKINVKDKILHCASSNMKVENGFLVSIKPIKPADFAVTCFPDAGTYEYFVSGLKKEVISGFIKAEF